MRRQHMTTKDDEIAVYGVGNERRGLALQGHVTFDRLSASHLIGTDAHQHLDLEPWLHASDAIENHVAGRWHLVALQESEEFFQQEGVTRQFFVTHFRGCATLFNKHMFESRHKDHCHPHPF